MGGGTVAGITSNSEWKRRVVEKGTRHPRVVVDFYASWCPPCRMIGPVFNSLSKDYSNVKFIKIDVDESKAIASRCGIQQMPTFQFYFEGELVNTLLGADKVKLEAMLKELASKESSEPEPVESEIVQEKRGFKAFLRMLCKGSA